ncbi:uncharacterized protein [Pyxicephalus adspersus]|uniref:uncharacterized protein n=1 Tax=Pyxicephalus adspersus TaxID=30357 RepID=UPI003B596F40
MGHAILALLCLWSCIMIAMPLNDIQVHRATEYIKNTFKLPENNQYAYAAVFSKQECNNLSKNNNRQILQNEKANEIANALNDDKIIYIGSQMVLALCKKKETNKECNMHAEYRLLFPPPESKDSPVQQLLNKNSEADCAVFFSLNSPCVGVCTNTKHDDNIIEKLSEFNKFKNQKAFIYHKVYDKDIASKKIRKENIWAGLMEINNKMTVYRCFPSKCLQCFEGAAGKNKGHCLN